MPQRPTLKTAKRRGHTEIAQAIATLRSRGGRLTTSKREILEVLHAASCPLTAEDIHSIVGEIDLANVYRTLTQLEELGIVTHQHLAHGAAVYRWRQADSLTVVCEDCGTVVELTAPEYRGLAHRLKTRHGMTLLPSHFALTARCDSCGEGQAGNL